MSHVEANSSHRRESIGGDTGYRRCPTCGFATIYDSDPKQDDYQMLLRRMRDYLAQHKADKKARLLIQEINVYLLAR